MTFTKITSTSVLFNIFLGFITKRSNFQGTAVFIFGWTSPRAWRLQRRHAIVQIQMMTERWKYCHYYSKNHLGIYINKYIYMFLEWKLILLTDFWLNTLTNTPTLHLYCDVRNVLFMLRNIPSSPSVGGYFQRKVTVWCVSVSVFCQLKFSYLCRCIRFQSFRLYAKLRHQSREIIIIFYFFKLHLGHSNIWSDIWWVFVRASSVIWREGTNWMLHNSFIELMFAQHVSGTIIPIIRSFAQHPSTLTNNLQPRTRPASCYNQGYVPRAVNICIVSSSWWWA